MSDDKSRLTLLSLFKSTPRSSTVLGEVGIGQKIILPSGRHAEVLGDSVHTTVRGSDMTLVRLLYVEHVHRTGRKFAVWSGIEVTELRGAAAV